MRQLTKRQDLLAFMAAFSLFLSLLEQAVPRPLPFLRLGLANFAILISLPLFNGKEIVLLAVLKAFGQAFVSGTLFSHLVLFSVPASFASATVMAVLFWRAGSFFSFPALSVAGALANNIFQLFFAYVYMGRAAVGIAPWLLLATLFSSLFMGLLATRFLVCSRAIKIIAQELD